MEASITLTRHGLRIAGFAAIFFILTSVTIAGSRFGGGVALVWFGAAVTAVMLLRLPRRLWTRAMIAILAANALATSLFGFGPGMAAPLALINGLEGWAIARLLIWLRPRRDWLDSVGGLAVLGIAGGFVAPGLASIPGGLLAASAAPGAWYMHSANWWAAHGLGTVIGFPMVYLASGAGLRDLSLRWSRSRVMELCAYLLIIAVVARLALGQALLPLLFLPILPLLLAAFRCGREGATLGTLIIAVNAVVAYHEPGTLIADLAIGRAQQVLFLQFYLATVSLLALPLSVALRRHSLLVLELGERKALERLVAEHSDDALLHLDDQGRIRYASPAGARLCGEDDLVGHGIARFFDPLDEPLVRSTMAQAAAAPGVTCVLERPVLCEENQRWLQAKIRAVAHEDKPDAPQSYAVTIRDVTQRKHTELDAIAAATTDPLTGLPNRRALTAQLEHALAHARMRPFALAILDLDHFKAINDTHGHNVGDIVLCEVAAVMRRLAGPGQFFARLGGEEFALVSRQRDFAATGALCEQLRREVAALTFTAPGGAPFTITASIGLAPIAEEGNAAEALAAADQRLYVAKAAGRNRVTSTLIRPRLATSRAA